VATAEDAEPARTTLASRAHAHASMVQYGPSVKARNYDALVLDVDGTLLDDLDQVHPRTRAALDRARAQGVVVMLATGRSSGGAREVIRVLGLDAPCVVYNGAAVYCPVEDRLITTYALPQAMVAALLAHAASTDLLPIVAQPDGRQLSRAGRTPEERGVLTDFRALEILPVAELPIADALRVTLLSARHPDSKSLLREIKPIATPAYLTHFPLAVLPRFRDSRLQIIDVQPECRGKAEAFFLLAERYGIERARVVAVGDEDNDLPMLREAGLGVAMGNGSAAAKRTAARIIDSNGTDALGALIEELFLDGV
jgi:5-amino-6-(5-phospho-D-ribitylamino)uracil phosphatase